MCDTFVASASSTAEGFVLFGKNSDRQRNEAQALEFLPRTSRAPGAMVHCTYLGIPQNSVTHAVILSRPFWLWGAEMGANEHGVVIGNESLHSRSSASEEPALIGMDLVRLGLERGKTAREAMDVMIQLLESFGQGGDCGYMTPYYYNNGFMIADPTEAFVLETIGREWLVERVIGVRTISNCYSIGQNASGMSAGVAGLLRGFGWSGGDSPNYADMIADKSREERGQAHSRRLRSAGFLAAREGKIGVADAATALRDHGPTSPSDWNPRDALPYGLCIHAGTDDRSAQTTGAMISELRVKDSVHWVTASAAPCISIFKPLLMDVPLPSQGPPPSGLADERNVWWRHERLHRAALLSDLPRFIRKIQQERDACEATFRSRVTAVISGGNADERSRVIQDCWNEAFEMEGRWAALLKPSAIVGSSRYFGAWKKMNRVAGIDTFESTRS